MTLDVTMVRPPMQPVQSGGHTTHTHTRFKYNTTTWPGGLTRTCPPPHALSARDKTLNSFGTWQIMSQRIFYNEILGRLFHVFPVSDTVTKRFCFKIHSLKCPRPSKLSSARDNFESAAPCPAARGASSSARTPPRVESQSPALRAPSSVGGRGHSGRGLGPVEARLGEPHERQMKEVKAAKAGDGRSSSCCTGRG